MIIHTLCATSQAVSCLERQLTIDTNSLFLDNGRTEHLYGAMVGDNDRYERCSSLSRCRKLSVHYNINSFK